MRGDTVKVIIWEKLYEAVQEDQVMVKLMEVVLRGFPQSSLDVDEDSSSTTGSDMIYMSQGESYATRTGLSFPSS